MKQTIYRLSILHLLVFALQVNSQTDINTGRVVQFSFTAGSLLDESGNALHIYTAPGVFPTLDRFGVANNAYSFTGHSGSFMSTPLSTISGIGNEGTIAVWAKQNYWTSSSPDNQIVNNGEMYNTPNAIYLSRHQSSGIHFRYWGGDPGTVSSLLNNYWLPSSWHHLVATWSVTGVGSTFIKLYTDGELRASLLVSYVKNMSVNGWNFGKFINNPHQGAFNGAIDDIVIYNRALNLSEIHQLYKKDCDTYFAIPPTISFDGTNLFTGTYPGANYAWSFNLNSLGGYNTHLYNGTVVSGIYTVTVTNAACVATASYNHTADGVNVNNGIFAHYPFNGNTNDVSVYGRHGTVSGIVTFTSNRFLTPNSALSVSGIPSSGNIKIPSVPVDDFTISFWIKRNRLNLKEDIIVSTNNAGYAVFFWPDNTIYLNRTGSPTSAISSFVINNFNWNYITITHKNNITKFYLNGIFSNQVNLNLNLISGSGYNISERPSVKEPFRGSLDEFKIYDRVINAAEVHALYTEGCPGFAATFSYGTVPFCQSGVASISGLSTVTGGSFVPQTGLSLNTVTGTINLAASSAGVYHVEYRIPAQYGCSSSSGFALVTILGVDNTTSNNSICADGKTSKVFSGNNVAVWNVLPLTYQPNVVGNTFTGSNIPGTVTVFGTNIFGCNSPIITFDISPIPTILTTTTSLYVGSSISLTGMNGDTWALVSGNGYVVGDHFYAGSVSGLSAIRYTNTTTGCSRSITLSGDNMYTYETGSLTVSGCSNQRIYLPIQVNSPVSSGIIGLDVIQTYPASIITPTGVCIAGPVLSTLGTVLTDVSIQGNQVIVGAAYDGFGEMSGSGVVLYLEFLPLSGITEGNYSFAGALITESYINRYRDMTATGGNLKVIGAPLPVLKGNLVYRDIATKPIINNTNTASGVTVIRALQGGVPTGTVTGSVDGSFSLTLGEHSFGIKIERDTPNSTEVIGDINSADALLVTKIINGQLASPTIYQLIAADVNGDSRVLSGDRTLIRRRAIKLINEWPNSVPDWKFIPLNHGFTGFNKNNVPLVPAVLSLASSLVDGCVKLPNQTFSGILIGDIDGMYQASINGANLRQESELGITVDLLEARYENDRFYVPVTIEKSANAIDLIVNFAKENMRIEGLSLNGAGDTADIASNVYNNEQFLVTMDRESTISQGSKVYTLMIKSDGPLKKEYFTSTKGLLDGKWVSVTVRGDVATSIEKSIESRVEVYPNPASNGLFQIAVLGGVSEVLEVELLNAFGSKVLGTTLISGKSVTEIDASGLPSGIYFLSIKHTAGRMIKKVIIK